MNSYSYGDENSSCGQFNEEMHQLNTNFENSQNLERTQDHDGSYLSFYEDDQGYYRLAQSSNHYDQGHNGNNQDFDQQYNYCDQSFENDQSFNDGGHNGNNQGYDQTNCEQGYYRNDQQFNGDQSFDNEQQNHYGNFQEEQQDFNGSSYNDGGYNGGELMYQQSQECLYNFGNENRDEQQDFYEEEHHYNPNLDNNECFYEDNPYYEEFPMEPQQEDKDSMRKIMSMLKEMEINFQKDIFEMKRSCAQMDVELQRRNEEMRLSREEVNEPYDENFIQASFDMPNQAIKELDYEDDYNLEDDISDPINEEESIPCEQEKIEEIEVQVQDVLMKNTLELENNDATSKSEQSSNGKEFDVKVDSTPLPSNLRYEDFILFDNELFDIGNLTLVSNEFYEDNYISFENDLFEDEFKIFENELFESEYTSFENPLFVNDLVCIDDDNPSFESLVSLESNSTLPIIFSSFLLDSSLLHNFTLKLSHVLELFEKVIGYIINHLRGRSPQIWSIQREVRPRLNGRKYKWDLKVD